MALCVQLCQDGLDDCFMAGVRSCERNHRCKLQFLTQTPSNPGQFITIGLRDLCLPHGGLLDLLAVFIEAGEKENFLAQAAVRRGQ